jgi:hypothetical protein
MSALPEPATTSRPATPAAPADERPVLDPAPRPDEPSSEERRRERYRV